MFAIWFYIFGLVSDVILDQWKQKINNYKYLHYTYGDAIFL